MVSRLNAILLSVFIILMMWCGAPAMGLAAEPVVAVEQSAPSQTGLDANAISSEKLSQFVQAYLKVVALIEQREGELQGAETESESVRVQNEIEKAALTEIEAAGLTIQEYLQLLGLANIDPEFSERVAAQLQEATN